MSGEQSSTGNGTGGRPNEPVYNPPSLTEPSQLTRPVVVQNAPAPVVPLANTVSPPAADRSSQEVPFTGPAAPLPGLPLRDKVRPAPEEDGFYRPAVAAAPAWSGTEPGRVAGLFPATDDAGGDGVASDSVSWTASGDDMAAASRTLRVRLLLAAAVLGGAIFLITRDAVSTGGVILACLLFGMLGGRRPQALQYRLDRAGITIGQKRYAYSEFRAFSLTDDQAPSIVLVPLKRFLPLMSLHFDNNQHDRIMTALAAHLPMEAPRHDAMDWLIGKFKI